MKAKKKTATATKEHALTTARVERALRRVLREGMKPCVDQDAKPGETAIGATIRNVLTEDKRQVGTNLFRMSVVELLRALVAADKAAPPRKAVRS